MEKKEIAQYGMTGLGVVAALLFCSMICKHIETLKKLELEKFRVQMELELRRHEFKEDPFAPKPNEMPRVEEKSDEKKKQLRLSDIPKKLKGIW